MNAAQDHWMRQRAIPFESCQPAAPLSPREQAAIDHILDGGEVIALGEMTHGAKEIFEARERVLRFLIRERALTAVVIEACFAATQRLNEYVLSGEGDAARALAETQYWSCINRETLHLIQWIREHNVSAKGRQHPVSIYGCDVQSMDGAKHALCGPIQDFGRSAHIDSHHCLESMAEIQALPTDRELHKSVVQLTTEAMSSHPDEARVALIQAARAEHMTGVREVVEPLARRLREWHQSLPANISKVKRFHFERCVRLLEQAIAFHSPGGFTSRDPSMAENVIAIAEHFGGAKLALLMHNLHVARVPLWIRGEQFVPTGSLLAKKLADQYKAIGSAFYRGTYLAAAGESAPGNEIATALTPRSDSFEYFLHQHAVAEQVSDLLLDFNAAGSQVDCPWPSSITMRSGEAGPQGDYAGAFLQQKPDAQFDGLIFLAEVTPITVLPEYFKGE